MKRYLISGALTLIAGLLVTSCHDKMENEYISNPVTVKTEEFDKAFKEAFTSNIDPNQDWGFGATKKRKANTRYANPTAADGNTAWALPDDIGTEEINKVVAHFANKSNYTANVLPGYINYWVQHVAIGSHSYPSEPDNNGATSTVRANDHMDKLVVKEGDNFTHVERFNASSGSKMFMQSSESRVFGWHNSNASEEITNRYLIQLIDGAYYVGFDFCSTKENHVVKPDGVYDDWIIKLVPGELKTDGTSETEEPVITGDIDDNEDDEELDNINNPGNQSDITTENLDYQQEITRTEYFKKRRLLQYGRVFCEDLGANYASNHKDFDYNDVVFDAHLYRDEIWKKKTKVNVYEVRKYEKQTGLERQKVDKDNNPVFETVRVEKKDDQGQVMKDEEGHTIYEEEPVPVMETFNAMVFKAPSETRIPQDEVQITWERVKSAEEIRTNGLDNDGKGRRYYSDILLMACGATKPIKVGAQRDGSPVKEVHDAFGGFSVDCIINTFDSHSEREGGFGYHELAEPVRLDEMEIPLQYITVENPTIKDIPIFIQGGTTEARTLEAKQGGIPQKFMSTNQDKWTSERCFLGDAYPNFNNWAENKDAVYSANSNADYLYNGSFPSIEQSILPFGVPTGAASTVCKDIELKCDTAIVNEEFIIRETADGSAWPTAEEWENDKWELYEKEDEGPRTGTVTNTKPEWKTIWSTTTPANSSTINIDKSKFANASANDVLRIYANGNTYKDWGWKVILCGQGWHKAQVSNWPDEEGTAIGKNSSVSSPWDSNLTYIEVTLTPTLLDLFKQYGAYIQTDWIPVSSVKLYTSGAVN